MPRPYIVGWANNWLSGEDRSEKSAFEVGSTLHYYGHPGDLIYTAAQCALGTVLNCGATSIKYADLAGIYAATARSVEVELTAKKWSPENWEEIYDLWVRDRQIDFEGLIEKAKS